MTVLVSFVVCIVGTEVVIKWNHLDGLENIDTTAAGPCMSLVVGVYFLVQAAMRILRGGR
jgi:hypothetical protein